MPMPKDMDSDATGAAPSGRRRVRVLSIHGGGMRGAYVAAYFEGLSKQAAVRQDRQSVDFGKAFDLIVGTSTGGIVACALAAGIPLGDILNVYLNHGKRIFPVKMPSGFSLDLCRQLLMRPKYLQRGSEALKGILEDQFHDLTIREVFDRRQIALAIPAVEMSHHRGWVFKTPHLGGHRDDDYRLVDVCMATTAAPLYRSMARIKTPGSEYHQVFVDGGLWANNPILVGLIDALRMTRPGDRIEVFSVSTCPPTPGQVFGGNEMHRGLKEWKFGGEVATVSLDAQGFVHDKMADMLAEHLDRDCHVIHFPQGSLPASATGFLDLDDTRDKTMDILRAQASADVSLTLSACDRKVSPNDELLADLLADLPRVDAETQGASG